MVVPPFLFLDGRSGSVLHAKVFCQIKYNQILKVWANPTNMPLGFFFFWELGGCGSEVKEIIVILLLTKVKKCKSYGDKIVIFK